LLALGVGLAIAAPLCSPSAFATDGTWADSPGSGNWSLATNWSGSTIADGLGATGNFNLNYSTNNKTITIDTTSRTLGILNIGDPGATYRIMTIAGSGGASLIFDNGGSGALLAKTTSTNTVTDVISAPVTLADNLTVNMTDTTTGSGLSFTGIISESGGARSITKTGNGALSLNNADTYTGTTTIESGAIIAGNAAALGNAPSAIALGNANSISNNLSPTFQVNGNTTVTRDITVGASNASTTGVYTIGTGNAASTSTLNATVTLNQNVTVANANATGTGGFTLAGSVISGAAGTQTVTFNVSALKAMTVSSVIGGGTGTIAITKAGAGITTLTGANTYTGGTTVNAGTLTIGPGGTLGATTGALAVNNSNTGAGTNVILNLAPAVDTTVGSLSGAIATPSSGTNTAVINTGGSGPNFTVNQTAAGTYAGVIAGPGSFTLGSLSTNTLTLMGANTYAGATTVNAGTLILQGSLQGAGNVNVNTGKLGGTGSILGNLSVGDGTGSRDAVLAPGVAGIGTLSAFNAVTFANDAVFALQINTDGTPGTDLLTTFGPISLDLGPTLNVENLGTTVLTGNQVFTFLSGASVTGTFAGLPDGTVFGVGSNFFEINYTDTTVELITVPEPASAAFLLGGLSLLAGVRRIRRRVA